MSERSHTKGQDPFARSSSPRRERAVAGEPHRHTAISLLVVGRLGPSLRRSLLMTAVLWSIVDAVIRVNTKVCHLPPSWPQNHPREA
jgi:hypothetical protein